MSTRRLPLWSLVLALMLLPLSLRATTVVAPAFTDLVGQADYVVRGVVKSVTSEWKENAGRKYIATKVEVEVHDVIKGTPPASVVLTMIGGRVGEDELTVEGAPTFTIGDEDILFVQGNGQQVYPLVGMMHGRYPIYHDAKSGQDLVVRSNGMPLYSEQDVSLPMNQLNAAKETSVTTQPMTAAAFIQKIRAVGAVTTNQPKVQR